MRNRLFAASAFFVYLFIPNSLVFGGAEFLCFICIYFCDLITSSEKVDIVKSGERTLLFTISILISSILISITFSNVLNTFDVLVDHSTLIMIIKILSFTIMGLILLRNLRSMQDILKTLKIFIFFSFISSAVLGIMQFAIGKRLLHSDIYIAFYQNIPFYRLTTFKIDDPNWAVLDLMPLVLLTFYFAFCSQVRFSFVWKGLFLVSLLAYILTFSRIGIVSLLLCLLGAALFAKGLSKGKKIFIMAVTIALCLIIGWIIISPHIGLGGVKIENIHRMLSSYNLEIRVKLWQQTLSELFKNYANLAFGLSGLDIKNVLYQHIHLPITNHSFYLTILFKFGLLGLTVAVGIYLYIAKIFLSLLRSFRKDKEMHDLVIVFISGFLGYLLIILFIAETYDFYTFFYLVLAIKISSIYASRSGNVIYD